MAWNDTKTIPPANQDMEQQINNRSTPSIARQCTYKYSTKRWLFCRSDPRLPVCDPGAKQASGGRCAARLPDGLEPSVQQLGLGADTPSFPSPGCLTPINSCNSTMTYTASPSPVEHLSMRNERMHNGVITNTPKLDNNRLLRSRSRSAPGPDNTTES